MNYIYIAVLCGIAVLFAYHFRIRTVSPPYYLRVYRDRACTNQIRRKYGAGTEEVRRIYGDMTEMLWRTYGEGDFISNDEKDIKKAFKNGKFALKSYFITTFATFKRK